MSAFADETHATVDGQQIAYRRAGGGSPVLLVHGIPTCSRLWDDVARQLASAHDVIAIDMLGYGRSSKPLDRDVSVTAQAELLPAFLDALGIDACGVVGHDIGGGVAQILAVNHPQRLTALGLIDAVCFDSWPIPAMTALKHSAPVVAKLPPGWVTATLLEAMKRQAPDPQHEALAACLSAWDTDRPALEAFFRNVEALDARHTEAVAPRLGEISVPTHIIWGAADQFQKPEYAPRLRDAIPASTLRMVDGGHFLPWDRPDEVAVELRALLERAQ